jgi:hypothetical protein
MALATAHAGIDAPAGALEELARCRAMLAARRARDPRRIEPLLHARGLADLRHVGEVWLAVRAGEDVVVTIGRARPHDELASSRWELAARAVLPLREVGALGLEHAYLVEALATGARLLDADRLSTRALRDVLVGLARELAVLHAHDQLALGLREEAVYVDEQGVLVGFSPRQALFRGDEDVLAGQDSDVWALAAMARRVFGTAADGALGDLLDRAISAPREQRPSLDELVAALGVLA